MKRPLSSDQQKGVVCNCRVEAISASVSHHLSCGPAQSFRDFNGMPRGLHKAGNSTLRGIYTKKTNSSLGALKMSIRLCNTVESTYKSCMRTKNNFKCTIHNMQYSFVGLLQDLSAYCDLNFTLDLFKYSTRTFIHITYYVLQYYLISARLGLNVVHAQKLSPIPN